MIYTEEEYYDSDESRTDGKLEYPENFTYLGAKVSFKDHGDQVTMYIEYNDNYFEETYSEEELDNNPITKESVESYIDAYIAMEEE